jgi:hypothetical protein
MSKATAAITDKFKRTLVRATDTITPADIERAYFKMGFRYFVGGRTPRACYPRGYVRVDSFGCMAYGSHTYMAEDHKEVTYEELCEAAEQVRKIKRKEGSEQKKRKAIRKWDATATKHTTNTCPVQPASKTIVSVKLRDGVVLTDTANYFNWEVDGDCKDVMSYKVIGYKKPKPEPEVAPVSLESMVEGIADSVGKGVAIPYEPDFSDRDAMTMDTQPDTNPKKQFGVASLPLEMWPDLASAYGALALYNGAMKYGKANFAHTPVDASIYIAGARRHLAAWVSGEECDPVDGVPHLGAVLANIAILLCARAAGTLVDDRMLLDGFLKERDTLKGHVTKINEVHAGKNPKHYTRDQA